MKRLFLVIAVVALLCMGIMAQADMLVDRGLPTANLNNAAGADRSNVAWVDGGYTANDYWLVGDTFTNTSAQTWSINSIRLWVINPIATATLWGGVEGGPISVVSSGVISAATYADSTTYQGSSGADRIMNQVDFGVNLTLAPGQQYDFFLDGTGGQDTIPFAHASNAALSGSPQDGADNSMLWADIVNGSCASIETWTSLGNGWDKASDVNVQVSGKAAVPEPMSIILGIMGLSSVAGFRRLRRK